MIEETRKGSFLLKRVKYHEAESVSAVRKREHPEWSVKHSDCRVAA